MLPIGEHPGKGSEGGVGQGGQLPGVPPVGRGRPAGERGGGQANFMGLDGRPAGNMVRCEEVPCLSGRGAVLGPPNLSPLGGEIPELGRNVKDRGGGGLLA